MYVCGEVKCAFALLCAPRVSSASTNASRGRARSRQTFASSADSTYSPRTAVGPLSPQLAVEPTVCEFGTVLVDCGGRDV